MEKIVVCYALFLTAIMGTRRSAGQDALRREFEEDFLNLFCGPDPAGRRRPR